MGSNLSSNLCLFRYSCAKIFILLLLSVINFRHENIMKLFNIRKIKFKFKTSLKIQNVSANLVKETRCFFSDSSLLSDEPNPLFLRGNLHPDSGCL